MRKKKLRITAAVVAAVLALCLAVGAMSLMPEVRVMLFVAFNGDCLERAILSDGGIPTKLGIKTYNVWANSDMVEFVLFSYGSAYYGCYYSISGQPYAFQGTDAELTPVPDERYTWQKDNNSGETFRIKGNWYYFKADF